MGAPRKDGPMETLGEMLHRLIDLARGTDHPQEQHCAAETVEEAVRRIEGTLPPGVDL
ncbi:MAG: hypothetical protein ACM33T_12250 [Solirubrobacterales bacterium]